MTLIYDEAKIRRALSRAWSLDTAVQWTAENPALGQCNVTAVVIQELYGGALLRTRLLDVWHYYNRFDGARVDFTDSQFSSPGALFEAPNSYDDEQATRSDAMTGIPEREYDALKAGLLAELGKL